jgi:uncharacterized membrane protein
LRITYLRHIWEKLHSSYWLVPTLLACAGAMLALGLVGWDQLAAGAESFDIAWVYGGGHEGARAVLGAIAGSMITVAGVVFSVTTVALTLASQQFGPRLLRRFMKDRGNQLVLGTFVATFVYTLLVLRTVRGENVEAFVPARAVTAAVVLAIVSLGVLIYFVHHVATSIQASRVIAAVGRELEHAIDRLFPERIGTGAELEVASRRAIPPPGLADLALPAVPRSPPGAGAAVDLQGDARAISSPASGYIQAVDGDELFEIATECDIVVRFEARPGDFVFDGQTLAHAWPATRVSERAARRVAGAVLLGNERTLEQDAKFGFDQLVEIAVRSLSPSMNDPKSAMACIDRIAASLRRLACRATPSAYRCDSEGSVRLIANPTSFAHIAEDALRTIQQHARASAPVTMKLLDAVAAVAPEAHRPADRAVLLDQAHRIHAGAEAALADGADRAATATRYMQIVSALRRAPAMSRQSAPAHRASRTASGHLAPRVARPPDAIGVRAYRPAAGSAGDTSTSKPPHIMRLLSKGRAFGS